MGEMAKNDFLSKKEESRIIHDAEMKKIEDESKEISERNRLLEMGEMAKNDSLSKGEELYEHTAKMKKNNVVRRSKNVKWQDNQILSNENHQNVNWIGVSLNNAILVKTIFNNADLRGAQLQEANLEGAQLQGAQLQGANIRSIKLAGANLSEADLTEVDLTVVESFIRKTTEDEENYNHSLHTVFNLTKAILDRSDLTNLNLMGFNFRETKLKGARLDLSILVGVDMSNADMDNAKLVGTQLKDANLSGTTLKYAILQNAHLEGADLSNADLSNADLRGADFRGTNLSGAKFNNAIINSSTKGIDFSTPNFVSKPYIKPTNGFLSKESLNAFNSETKPTDEGPTENLLGRTLLKPKHGGKTAKKYKSKTLKHKYKPKYKKRKSHKQKKKSRRY